MWMQTYNGNIFDFSDPRPRVVLLDCVMQLSYIPRFNGAAGAYSVLQHMCLVHDLCLAEDKPQGLMHDIHEAYTGDFIHPLKIKWPALADVDDLIKGRVRTALGLPFHDSPGVKYADIQALRIERDLFMTTPPQPWDTAVEAIETPTIPWVRWDPIRARSEFWRRYRPLKKEGRLL